MGCYDIFCTLCGGPLNTGTIWDSVRSPDPKPDGAYWDYNQNLLCDEDLEWLRDVRIIGEWQSKANQDKQHNVAAETFYASEFDACSGPFDATDANGRTHWCYVFAKGENEDHYPGNHFVMHSACLLIVRRWMYEEGKSTQDLYDVLCVYDEDLFRGVYLPNRHYGSERFWEQDWVAKQGWEFVVKDPVNVPGMTEYILSKLRPVESEEDKWLEGRFNPDSDTSPCTARDAYIERLPVECIERICTYLPLASTYALRLSCATLASRVSLNQDFYRKQLLSGHLFALQDLDLGLIRERWDEIKDKDWRRLVRTLARYENFDVGEDGSGVMGELCDAPIGLKNRMRVVKIIQGVFTGHSAAL